MVIVRGLATTVDAVDHLVGVRCPACDTHAFPSQDGCPRCGAMTEPVVLPTDGTVWSWTIQHHRPKPPFDGPEDFEPFVVGYVDLGPVKVETRLEGLPNDAWTIGTPVRASLGRPDDRGDLWRFRFVADGTDR